MNKSRFMTQQEREAYRIGYECGRQEGLKKASLLIQLVASDSSEFKGYILQNSKEAAEMVRILTTYDRIWICRGNRLLLKNE